MTCIHRQGENMTPDEARKWLNGGGAKKVLLPEDRWEKNGKAAE